MQNYFTLYTLFIKGDTKFWLVVLDKYKKLQTRHKGLTLILKYKSALLCCISLRRNTKFVRDFTFPVNESLSICSVPSHSLLVPETMPMRSRPGQWLLQWRLQRAATEENALLWWVPFTLRNLLPYTLWLTAQHTVHWIPAIKFWWWQTGGPKPNL